MSEPEPPPDFQPPPPITGGPIGTALIALWAALGLAHAVIHFAVAAGVPVPGPLLIPMALEPWAVVTWLTLGFGLWTLIPDRTAPPILLAAGALLATLAWGPGWVARPDAHPDDVPLRVLTWNLGRLSAPAAPDPDPPGCAAALLAEADADILVLQEIGPPAQQALARAAGLRCTPIPYLDNDTPSSVTGHGLCVRDGGPWSVADVHGQPLPSPNRYQAVFATLRHPDAQPIALRGVHLYAHHLLAGPPDRYLRALGRFAEVLSVQLDQAAALLDSLPPSGPVVMAGDFNTTPGLPPLRALDARVRDTWPRGAGGYAGSVHPFGWLPLRVDHVLASPDIGVRGAHIAPVGCSDHRPVIVDLRTPRHTP